MVSRSILLKLSSKYTKMNADAASERKEMEICALCKCFAKQKCSSCKSVYYCCRDHQKLDWPMHKNNCQIYKLVENPTLGRHYIATRNIEIGEIIFKEKNPLLVALTSQTEPVCLNCYVNLTSDNFKPCKNCGWTLCSNCTVHGPECQLTMKYLKSKIKVNASLLPSVTYYAVNILRALDLREKNPKNYKALLNLEDHYSKIKNTVSPTANLVKKGMKLNDMDEETIIRILAIIQINSFGRESEDSEDSRHCVVFDKLSYIAHDCHPNCSNISDQSKTCPQSMVQAVRMIPKGEVISIAYIETLYNTDKRRKVLRETKLFDCMCKRCTDPTEFGTMFSAVKCVRKNCTGYMLPPTFLVSNHERIPDFVCDKCNLTVPSSDIDNIMAVISKEFSKVDKENYGELNQFIDEQSKILHANHYHIINAKIKVIGILSKGMHAPAFLMRNHSNPDAFLKENAAFCRNLRKQLEILAIDNYVLITLCTYVESTCIFIAACKEKLQNSSNASNLFKEAKKLQIEGFRMFRHPDVMSMLPDMAKKVQLWLEDFSIDKFLKI